MTPWQKRSTELTRRMAEDMKIRNFSPRTIDTYTYHLGRFAEFLGRSPLEATVEDVRSFQLHLIDERKVGWSTFNQAVCGLRFFFRFTCPKPWPVAIIPFGSRPKKLPAVLSGEEVSRLLSCVTSLKHRTFLLVQYAAGLRLNEAAQLTIPDIDSARMQLRIGSGKGQKARVVPMSPRLLAALREYWKTVKSPHYLFPGRTFDAPLSSTTVQKMVKLAAHKAGIRKDISPHTMRHSYATGLLEAGVDLLTISHLLGHASFSTTMVYLHVRRLHLGSAPSPIDWLPVRQLPGWQQPPIDGSQEADSPKPEH